MTAFWTRAWDFRNTPSDSTPAAVYHPLDIYRKQVINSRRYCWHVPAGRCVFPGSEAAELCVLRPLTTGDSSLSSCIEAIIAHDRRSGENDGVRMAALLMIWPTWAAT